MIFGNIIIHTYICICVRVYIRHIYVFYVLGWIYFKWRWLATILLYYKWKCIEFEVLVYHFSNLVIEVDRSEKLLVEIFQESKLNKYFLYQTQCWCWSKKKVTERRILRFREGTCFYSLRGFRVELFPTWIFCLERHWRY